ncbi:hypothetical protein B0J17DRAFT_628672 [Rhizoctonia solani]|nr:hypothetical protein B0J17DRAFT_628672 [Rhizoctonia solani]
MAPLDPAVYSADYERRTLIAPSRSSLTPSAAQTFHLPVQGTLGHLLYKGERASYCVGFSPGSGTKHSQNIKRQHKLQPAGSNISYLILQKTFPSPGNYLVQVESKNPSSTALTVKSKPEPEFHSTPCSLLKSLSPSNSPPPVQVPKHDQDADLGIKPEQAFKLDSRPEAFDQKDSSQPQAMVQGVCGTMDVRDNHVPPATVVNDFHRRDVRESTLAEVGQIVTKTPLPGHRSSGNFHGLISNHPRVGHGTVYRPHLINKRHISQLLYNLARLRAHRPGANRLSTRVAVQPPSQPQPPEDSNHELPEHQAAPQSSRLFKSLYGLSQCLRSQTDASNSSFHYGNASNTPTFNQGSFGATQASNTTGTTNSSVNNPGQHTYAGSHGTTNHLGLEGLDRNWLFEFGMHCCLLALQPDVGSANEGAAPQDHFSDSFFVPPNDPGLLYTHPDPGIQDNLAAAQLPSTSGDHDQLQSHLAEFHPGGAGSSQHISASMSGSQPLIDVHAPAPVTPTHIAHQFVGENFHTHSEDHGHSSSPNPVSNHHLTATNPFDSHPAIPNCNPNASFHPHVRVFRVGQPHSEAPSSAGAHRTRGRSPKVCKECHQVFQRASYLREHMHIHTGVKLHKCPNCDKPLAYRSGVSKHLTKCPLRAGQS